MKRIGKSRTRRTRAVKPVAQETQVPQPATLKTKGLPQYTGAPLPATRVLTRRMTEFTKTTADCILIIDTVAGTYSFANTYRAGILPPSYDPAKYRYALNDKALKRLEAKIEKQGFQEIEITEWPSWIVPAVRRRERKAT